MNAPIRSRVPSSIAFLVTTAILVSGCGATVTPRSSQDPAPVSVENCGRKITYPEPKRPVAYDMSATEKMFALGLADRLAGIVLPATAHEPASRSAYRADYRRANVIGTDVLSREAVIAAKADWVLAGWNSGFSEQRGITPALLDKVGIKSYMFTESCFNYGDKPVQIPPFEANYTDLRQIGKIFHVEQRAHQLIERIRTRAAKLRREQPQGEPARVFVYDSGTDQPFTSGRQAAPNEIIELAGGRNVLSHINDRWSTVGWEPVVKSAPEVITVVDYGDRPVGEKIDFLKTFPPLADSPAVKKNRFFVLDYGMAVNGPRNIDAAEQLAAYLRSIGK